LGVKVEEVAVGAPQFPHPPVRIQSLSVAPRWAALFGDNPGVSYRARAWHGTIDGVAYRDGSVAATLTDLRFDEPLGERLPLRLKGTLSSGSFDGVVPLQNKKRSQLRLEMDGLELAGLRSMGVEGDVVTLGKLDCLVDANGMTLTLKTFEIVGPELSASGSGFVRLGRRLERSLVNLTLDVKPGTGFDPFLLDMLKLGATAGNDGSYRIQLRGPLRSVQLVR
jgi:type II secretion system protein N